MNTVLKSQIHTQAVAVALKAAALPEWQLQDAKNRFSQVVRAARDGSPQWVTVHGKRAAVVLSAEAYEAWLLGTNALAASAVPVPKMSLLQALQMDLPEGGLTDEEVDCYFGRDRSLDTYRGVDL